MMDSVHNIRRKHRRTWSTVLLCLFALLLAVGLTACKKDQGDETESTVQQEQTSGETTESTTEPVTETETETEPETTTVVVTVTVTETATEPETETIPETKTAPETEPETEPESESEPTIVPEMSLFGAIDAVGGMCTDSYFETEERLKDGDAADWLATYRPNGISGVESVGFRGWAYINGEQTVAFGYVLDNGGVKDAVWNGEFERREDVADAFGCDADTAGYKITIRLADIPAGEHMVSLLLKTANGNVYRLTLWGDITIRGRELESESETYPATEPATDPATEPSDPHPGDASVWEGLMIDQVYGTGKKATDAALSHGYIQLYNASSKPMSLSGVSLYYSDGEKAYRALALPTDAVIPAGGCYLIRANSPSGYDESTSIVSLTEYDLEWNIYIDNKEVRLLLAPSGRTLDVTDDITALEDAISVFFASETVYNGSVYAVDDLSKNKVAIRTARTDYSGYHTVNLTRASSSLLERICTSTSAGKTNDILRPRISEVTFSHAAGLYDSSIDLTLTGPAGYNIYYTTDGSDPTTSSTRKKYTGAVLLTDSGEMAWGPMIKKWGSLHGSAVPTSSRLPGGYVIKAYATNSIESTAVFTNTYFIGADLEQYDVPIVSLSIPLDEMLGSNGFYSNYCPTGVITDKRPRGTAIMEVFDPDGGRVGNSRVELAVSGNGSSGWSMKSLRIYYKGSLNKEAGLESDLNYDIFGGLATDANGQAITSFSRLLLRNSGNDCNTSFIRDAYMQRACSVLNIDTMASASTLVFVNGEFWGVYNMRERYSPEYVESHYGVNKDNVVVIESDYSQVHTNTNADYVLSAGVDGDEKPFNDLVQYIREHDLSDQAAYDYVASQMDIDSFTDMWVARLFFVARDWPENNVKVWRNKDENDPSGVDTKWHFVMLDMDMGLSFYTPEGGVANTTETENFFWAFSSDSVCGTIMRGLMNNAAYKKQFIQRYYEVFTDIFTPDYLSDLFEELYVERDALMPLQVKRWGNAGASVSTWRNAADLIRSFINNRQAIGLRHMYGYFHISESDIESATKSQIGFSFNGDRVSVSCNGTAATTGRLIWVLTDSRMTIQATAEEGYTLTSIVWVGKDGTTRTVSVSGTTASATFTVTGAGTIWVYAKSTTSVEPGTTPTTPIKATDLADHGKMSADTYFENNAILQDGSAHEWLAANRPDGISGVMTADFRGWAFVTGETATAFGYVLDDGGMENIVWNSFAFETRGDVAKAFGCDAETAGYRITVDISDIPSGEHTVRLLLKTEKGIYELSQWGEIRIVGVAS